jgi:hypothetical protein
MRDSDRSPFAVPPLRGRPSTRSFGMPAVLTVALFLVSGCGEPGEDAGEATPPAEAVGVTESGPGEVTEAYEVWIVDQSDSNHEGGFGGTLHIFDGAAFEGGDLGGVVPTSTVDLGAGTAELCRTETQADPVRPHMLLFNLEGTHAILSFVGSGHVAILDADSRDAVACFRTAPGAGGAQQAHAAFPAPDGSYIVVANQNGKLLERIDTDFATGSFTYNAEATLDLVNGLTPAGLPRESEQLRPDNAPICPVIDRDSRYTWVTLRGGGLFVVDARETPMRIVAEYDRETVAGNGCGGVETGGAMFINSGGAPVNLQGADHPYLHLHGFDVYRFPLSGYGQEVPNQPLPDLVFSVDGEADSHGMVAVRSGTHIWVADRNRSVMEVIEAATGEHANTIDLAGALSEDPAPDLLDIAPSGDLIFASLRGSVPLTGDPHNATGTTPGLGVVTVGPDGVSGQLAGISHFTNIHEGRNVADPHAVRVRPLR